MQNITPAIAATVIGFVFGGIVISVNHVLSFAAVLRGSDKAQVERATAYGFYLGALLSVGLLLIDRL